MNNYDVQYTEETQLFGEAYPEFDDFLKANSQPAGRALDIGCGQGRDSLLLARHGYAVVGIDSSKVGIEQMLTRAKQEGLTISGIVGDIFDDLPTENFDLIVLDSILHFQSKDKAKELALLDSVWNLLHKNGLLVVFVHNNQSKVDPLNLWTNKQSAHSEALCSQVLDYLYEEKATGFASSFKMFMSVHKKLT